MQNADDEAENLQQAGILIRLEQNRLVVANHGLPFTAHGILSLMYSNNSPKITRQKKIGYKGLGFRAILNWSESILIKSGAFSLEFSRRNAVDFLNGLMTKNPGLKEEIDSTGSGEHPIATLAAPKWKPPDSSVPSGYDTSVIINFSSAHVRENIQDQINELGLEVALFLNNLKEIKLESPGRTETIARKTATPDHFEEIQLIDNEGHVKDSKRWRIFPKSGEIPQDLRNENIKQYEYDLRIAVSDKLDDNINRLFCYFKTEVTLPFPAIIHGTFELDGNRNHLTETKVNEFLLERLGELMTEAAKNITQSQEDVTWDAMKLLARRGELDDKLTKMNFYKKLLTSIRKEALIPVLSNKYMSVEEKPVFYDIPLSETLETAPSDFPELALYTSDKEIQTLLHEPELGIGPYSAAHLVKKLTNLSKNFTLDTRAHLIILLANNYDKCLKPLEPDKTPSLFVDDQGERIAANTKAFLPPERARFQLPKMVTLVFISSDLSADLRSKAGVKSNDALAEKLACFNVQPYRAAAVIRRIVVNTNRTIKKSPSKKKEYIQQMVQALFIISSDETTSDSKFPERVNVPLFTRKGVLRNARALYFGSEYSAGRMMDALYSGIDDTVFITNKDDLGLAEKPESEAIKFLKWVGVEDFPRMTIKNLEKESCESGYETFVLNNLKYPYQTTWFETYQDYNKLKDYKQYRSVITVHDIPELEAILSKAKFEHVLSWLHLDPRIQELIKKGCEPSGSHFGLRLHKKQQLRNLREREISPYILWKLKAIKWVKAKSGQKVTPEKCCLSENLERMSPLIEIPEIDAKDPILKEMKVELRDLRYALSKIGASEDLTNLPTESIYSILSKLETADLEGSKAKSIYKGIINSKPKEWDSTLKESEAYQAFLKDGKILAKTDGKTAYIPVSKAYNVGYITFPKQIMNRFPIAEIPRRLGKERINDIFGIKPLEDIIGFLLASEPELRSINAQFSQHFETFKPYVLVFRHGTSKFSTEFNSLKKFKVCLCKRIDAKYSFDNQEWELTLNPYEHIQPSGENSSLHPPA